MMNQGGMVRVGVGGGGGGAEGSEEGSGGAAEGTAAAAPLLPPPPLAAGSGARVKVDLEAQTLTLADGSSARFPVDAFPKRCMLLGVDELGYLLQFEGEIAAFEAAHPAPFDTRAAV